VVLCNDNVDDVYTRIAAEKEIIILGYVPLQKMKEVSLIKGAPFTSSRRMKQGAIAPLYVTKCRLSLEHMGRDVEEEESSEDRRSISRQRLSLLLHRPSHSVVGVERSSALNGRKALGYSKIHIVLQRPSAGHACQAASMFFGILARVKVLLAHLTPTKYGLPRILLPATTEVECAKRMPEGAMKSALMSLQATWKRNNHISEEDDDAKHERDEHHPAGIGFEKDHGSVSFLPAKCAIIRRAVAFMRLVLTCDTITT